jgi:hypothetical protein
MSVFVHDFCYIYIYLYIERELAPLLVQYIKTPIYFWSEISSPGLRRWKERVSGLCESAEDRVHDTGNSSVSKAAILYLNDVFVAASLSTTDHDK